MDKRFLRKPFTALFIVAALLIVPHGGSTLQERDVGARIDTDDFDSAFSAIAQGEPPSPVTAPPRLDAPDPPSIVSGSAPPSSYTFVVRSNGSVRVANLRPLAPTGVSFTEDAAHPRIAGLPLGDDVVVTLDPPTPLNTRTTVTVTVSRPGMPLEFVARAPESEGGSFIGFATARAPARVTLAFDPRSDGAAIALSTLGAQDAIEIFGGAREGGLARVHLAPAPTRARVDLAFGTGDGHVVWEADRVTDVRVHATADGTIVRASADAMPRAFTLKFGATGARWSASANATHARVDIAHADAQAFGLSLAPFPRTGSFSLTRTGEDALLVAYAADAKAARAEFYATRDGRGVHTILKDAPASFTASRALDTGDAVTTRFTGASRASEVFFAGGALSACASLPRAFLYVNASESAGCTAFRVPGLLSGSARFADASLRVELDAIEAPLARIMAVGAFPADVRLAPFPARMTLELDRTGRGANVTFETSTRTRVEGTVGWNPPRVPAEGFALATGDDFAASFNLTLPRVLRVTLARETTSASESEENSSRTTSLDATRFPDILNVTFVTRDDGLRVAWTASSPTPNVTLTFATKATRARLTLGALPASGHVDADGARVTYDLGAPTRLDAAILEGSGAFTLPLSEGENTIVTRASAAGHAARIRLAAAPARASIAWRDGVALAYEDGGGGFLAIHIASDAGSVATTIPLPERLEVNVTVQHGAFGLTWQAPTRIPAIDAALTDAAGDASVLSLRNLPRELALDVRSGERSGITLTASEPGLSIHAGGPGRALGLGAGGGFIANGLPERVSVAYDARVATLEASAPVNATLTLGDARWGSAWLGFTTADTRFEISEITRASVHFGAFGVDVEGDGGRIGLTHASSNLATPLLLPAWGSATGGVNHAEVELAEGAGFVLYAMNAHVVVLDVMPALATAIMGACAGAFYVSRKRRKET